jgi:hypothetical protein
VNACCILLGSLLPGGKEGMKRSSRELQRRMKSFKGEGE